jgi:hypothetical protein
MSISADSDDHSEGVEDMQETCWCNKYCNKWLWGLSLKKPENIGRCCRTLFYSNLMFQLHLKHFEATPPIEIYKNCEEGCAAY